MKKWHLILVCSVILCSSANSATFNTLQGLVKVGLDIQAANPDKKANLSGLDLTQSSSIAPFVMGNTQNKQYFSGKQVYMVYTGGGNPTIGPAGPDGEKPVTVTLTSGTMTATADPDAKFSGTYASTVGDPVKTFSYLRLKSANLNLNYNGTDYPILDQANITTLNKNAWVGINDNSGFAYRVASDKVPTKFKPGFNLPFFIYYKGLKKTWSIRFSGLKGPNSAKLQIAWATAPNVTSIETGTIQTIELANPQTVSTYLWIWNGIKPKTGGDKPYVAPTGKYPAYRIEYGFGDTTRCSSWTVLSSSSSPDVEDAEIKVFFSPNQSYFKPCT